MKKLILLFLFATTSLFAQKWEFKENKNYKIIDALNLTNSIRKQATLKPISLSKRLNNLALSRLDSIEKKGFYQPSLDSTGEVYYHTSKEFDNYFYNAVIGLIVPGDNIFTYEQITCEFCEKIGFASKNIDGKNWTMLVFDVLY